MNFRLAGSERFAPEPGDFLARGLTMRPGTESEPEIDCSESLRGLGLMMRSEGLPRNDAAVMLIFSAVAILRWGRWTELFGEMGSASEGGTRLTGQSTRCRERLQLGGQKLTVAGQGTTRLSLTRCPNLL